MKRKLLLTILLVLLLCPLIQSQNLLNAPEGIVFDSVYNRYLVSNWNSGAIVAIDSFGVQSYFSTGLGNCSGMEIMDTVLYVSCNNQDLVGLNLRNGTEIFRMTLSYQGLHGITQDSNGYLYVNNGGGGKVYKVDPVAHTQETFASAGLYNNLGIVCDEANNRLVIVSYEAQHAIQSVDLTTGGVATTIIMTTHPNMDDIDMDDDGNFYISAWNDDHNWIYRYDNSFSNPPETLVYNDNHGLIDICYNKTNHTLAHCDYWTNKVTYEQLDLQINQDTSYGFIPFPINFNGTCFKNVTSWEWDFGNGSISSEQSPSVDYTEVGIYDVTLTAITIDDDTLTRVSKYGVVALNDSLAGDSVNHLPGETAVVTVTLNNNIPCSKIKIPIEYGGVLNLNYDSISTVGCRTEYFESVLYSHFDGANSRLSISLSCGAEPMLSAGDGVVAKLYFTINSSALSGTMTEIDFSGYTSGTTDYFPIVESPFLFYNPLITNGKISSGCCIGMRGDYNNDGGELLDISDLLFLVDFMFLPPGEAEAPQCLEESDMDLNNALDITDLLFVVDYMFLPPGEAPSPPSCQ